MGRGKWERPDRAGLSHRLAYLQRHREAFEEFKPEGDMFGSVFRKSQSGGIIETGLEEAQMGRREDL